MGITALLLAYAACLLGCFLFVRLLGSAAFPSGPPVAVCFD